MYKVCVADPINEAALNRLKTMVEVTHDTSAPEALDGIIVRTFKVNDAFMEKAKKLKIISIHAVGMDNVDLKAAKKRGIPVTNVPGQSAESVAELALAGILAISRNMKKANTGICESRYAHHGQYDFVSHEVAGKTLGLIGAGRIAQKLAKIMDAAFGIKVLAYDPFVSAEKLAEIGMTKVETVEELFAGSDIVSVHVPLTPGTRNLISKSAFEAAKPDLILASTARGGVVDEEALYEALATGKIHGAFCDVFASEPPKKDNPLVHLENFIATPHVGGNTAECLVRVGEECVDNCLKGLGLM